VEVVQAAQAAVAPVVEVEVLTLGHLPQLVVVVVEIGTVAVSRAVLVAAEHKQEILQALEIPHQYLLHKDSQEVLPAEHLVAIRVQEVVVAQVVPECQVGRKAPVTVAPE
jgi:hypothetical protein